MKGATKKKVAAPATLTLEPKRYSDETRYTDGVIQIRAQHPVPVELVVTIESRARSIETGEAIQGFFRVPDYEKIDPSQGSQDLVVWLDEAEALLEAMRLCVEEAKRLGVLPADRLPIVK
jgi:hypothetical protein